MAYFVLFCFLLTEPIEYSEAIAVCAEENFQLWSLEVENLWTIANGILDSNSQYWVKGKVDE